MGSEDLSVGGCQATPAHVMRDSATIDAELRLVRRFADEEAKERTKLGLKLMDRY